MSKAVDYIIVGQGLAGSLLAWELLKRGKTVQLFDREHQGAASAIAAGIINPITGRRFAKSWRIDELMPFAKQYYQALEAQLRIRIWHDRSVLRFLKGNKDINDWYGRSSWEGFSTYMHEYEDMEKLADLFHLPFGIGEVRPAAQVGLGPLIIAFRKYFLNEGMLSNQKIDVQDVSVDELLSKFKEYTYKKIIFCEGYQARFNPLFEAIPFEPAKGEVLIIKIPGLSLNHLLKNKLMLAPLGNDFYWAGSNYEWDAPHDQPTQAFRDKFILELQKTLKLDFEVVDHQAAIRPTIKDRRPVLGVHPEFPTAAIFNGLGTKGASLGPFFAKVMSEHLLDNASIDPELNLQRFF